MAAIDRVEIRKRLELFAGQINDLAARMKATDANRPANAHEKQLVRMAYMSEFMETTDMLQVAYLTGNVNMFESEQDHLRHVIETTSI